MGVKRIEIAYVSAEFKSTDKLKGFCIFNITTMSLILSNDLESIKINKESILKNCILKNISMNISKNDSNTDILLSSFEVIYANIYRSLKYNLYYTMVESNFQTMNVASG